MTRTIEKSRSISEAREDDETENLLALTMNYIEPDVNSIVIEKTNR